MKIAIVSDIHDNIANWRRFQVWAEKQGMEALLCCGDLTNADTLREMAGSFSSPIYLVRGNACFYPESELREFTQIQGGGRLGRYQLDSYKIGLCHEPYLIDKVLETGDCNLVFYGHTHKPWIDRRRLATIANPGTLAGINYPASFACLDTASGCLELKLLSEI